MPATDFRVQNFELIVPPSEGTTDVSIPMVVNPSHTRVMLASPGLQMVIQNPGETAGTRDLKVAIEIIDGLTVRVHSSPNKLYSGIVTFSLLEYTGDAGGPSAFSVVRDAIRIPAGSNGVDVAALMSPTAGGAGTSAYEMPSITGVIMDNTVDSDSDGLYGDDTYVIPLWRRTPTVNDLTVQQLVRPVGGQAVWVYLETVFWSGSNWTVQPAPFGQATAGASDTITFTDSAAPETDAGGAPFVFYNGAYQQVTATGNPDHAWTSLGYTESVDATGWTLTANTNGGGTQLYPWFYQGNVQGRDDIVGTDVTSVVVRLKRLDTNRAGAEFKPRLLWESSLMPFSSVNDENNSISLGVYSDYTIGEWFDMTFDTASSAKWNDLNAPYGEIGRLNFKLWEDVSFATGVTFPQSVGTVVHSDPTGSLNFVSNQHYLRTTPHLIGPGFYGLFGRLAGVNVVEPELNGSRALHPRAVTVTNLGNGISHTFTLDHLYAFGSGQDSIYLDPVGGAAPAGWAANNAGSGFEIRNNDGFSPVEPQPVGTVLWTDTDGVPSTGWAGGDCRIYNSLAKPFDHSLFPAERELIVENLTNGFKKRVRVIAIAASSTTGIEYVSLEHQGGAVDSDWQDSNNGNGDNGFPPPGDGFRVTNNDGMMWPSYADPTVKVERVTFFGGAAAGPKNVAITDVGDWGNTWIEQRRTLDLFKAASNGETISHVFFDPGNTANVFAYHPPVGSNANTVTNGASFYTVSNPDVKVSHQGVLPLTTSIDRSVGLTPPVTEARSLQIPVSSSTSSIEVNNDRAVVIMAGTPQATHRRDEASAQLEIDGGSIRWRRDQATSWNEYIQTVQFGLEPEPPASAASQHSNIRKPEWSITIKNK